MTAEFSDLYYSANDGLKLHARVYGEEISGATPVVCLPGLSRNARDFHELALFLSRREERPRRVVVFDYRGRGLSAYDRNWRNYDVRIEAADVDAGLIAAGIEKAHFIGTSRGGLIIHGLGSLRPTVMKSIVLNDIGPVVEGEGLAQIRSYLERSPKAKGHGRGRHHPARRARHGLSRADRTGLAALYRGDLPRSQGTAGRRFRSGAAEGRQGFRSRQADPGDLASVRGASRLSHAGHPRRQLEAPVGGDARRNGAPPPELPDSHGRGSRPPADCSKPATCRRPLRRFSTGPELEADYFEG